MEKLFRFYFFLKPYRLVIANTILVTVILTVINLVPPWLVKVLIDNALPYQDIRLLNIIIIIQLLVVFNNKFIGSIQNFLFLYLEQKITIDVNKHLFDHLLTLPISFFNNNEPGELVHRFTQDVMAIRSLLSGLIVQVFVHSIMLIFLLLILFYINVKLAIICIFIALIYGINANIFKNRIYSTAKDVGEKTSALYTILYQLIPGIREIKGSRLYKFARKMYLEGVINLFRANIRNFKLSVKVSLIADIFPVLAWVSIIGIGGREVIRGSLTIGSLLAFANYVDRIYGPINGLSGIYSTLQANVPAMNRVLKVMDTEPEFNKAKGESLDANIFHGGIELRSIGFSYIKDRPVLKNINIKIKPGSKVAIVGPSGGGKSTIANLMVRFFDVSSGSIYLEGINVKRINPESLRTYIGIVPQGIKLFPTTIKNNIRMGKRQATDEEIIKAADIANAHDFIINLPSGYDTLYGEKGVWLSGGETQRVVLARVVLQNPKILILDEAMAFIDADSEYLIHEAIKKISHNRTMIVIAHKFSTIVDADWIYVINQGMIAEEGKHDQLMENKGLYHKLYQRQQIAELSNRKLISE